MEIVILLIIAGYAIYGIYLLLLHYGHIIIPVAIGIWLLPKALKLCGKGLNAYDARLAAQKKAESSQQDLFARFSEKKRYLYALHPLQFVVAALSVLAANEAMKHIREYVDDQNWIYQIPYDYHLFEEPFYWVLFFVLIVVAYRIGLNLFNVLPFDIKLFPTTKALCRYAANPQNPRVALERAHAMRESAKHCITSPYSLFLFLDSLIEKQSHTVHYSSKRLNDTLAYLEKHFPHTYDDEEFRRKYWNYARHIFALLHFRGELFTENSFFALPYPEAEKIKLEETQNALQKEREKFQNAPLDVWSKSPHLITLEDALEVIGLTDIPSIKILHKLHLAVLEEHKDDPQKAHITAKAFEILGREAVIKEMLSL